MDFADIKMMSVSELEFDLENPRLAAFDLKDDSTETEVIEILWESMDVHELVLSIAASGYFKHEPLIVERVGGKNIVIEGNRRLAAVKVLITPDLARSLNASVPAIDEEDRNDLLKLPTIASTRRDAWRYIGFKHVNGPAKWSSYAKSQYIAMVRREFGFELKDIAQQIGDTHNTVQRLFRGMMVIEQAERMEVFDRRDRWNSHFASSHLYTGLGYSGISSFISLRPESEEENQPVPEEKKLELRELFLWLYGSKKEAVPPVIQSQNPDLRRLDSVLANREAVAALRSGISLSYAFEISRPSSNVFEESLHEAKRSLEKARSLLSTGYDGSQQLLTIADQVLTLAEDLYDEMSRKRVSVRKRGGRESD